MLFQIFQAIDKQNHFAYIFAISFTKNHKKTNYYKSKLK